MDKITCLYCGSDISGIGVHCPECGKYADGATRIRAVSPVRIKVTLLKEKIKRYWLHLLWFFVVTILYHFLSFLSLNRVIILSLQVIIHIFMTVFLIFLADKFKEELETWLPFLKSND